MAARDWHQHEHGGAMLHCAAARCRHAKQAGGRAGHLVAEQPGSSRSGLQTNCLVGTDNLARPLLPAVTPLGLSRPGAMSQMPLATSGLCMRIPPDAVSSLTTAWPSCCQHPRISSCHDCCRHTTTQHYDPVNMRSRQISADLFLWGVAVMVCQRQGLEGSHGHLRIPVTSHGPLVDVG